MRKQCVTRRDLSGDDTMQFTGTAATPRSGTHELSARVEQKELRLFAAAHDGVSVRETQRKGALFGWKILVGVGAKYSDQSAFRSTRGARRERLRGRDIGWTQHGST